MATKEELVRAARNLLTYEKAIRDHQCSEYYCLMPDVGPLCPEANKLVEHYEECKHILVKLLETEE